MDLSTILGLVVALLGTIGGTMLEGGDPGALVNMPAFAIVFGGTLGATLVSFPMPSVLSIPRLVVQTIRGKHEEMAPLINRIITLADQARKEGLLSLQGAIKDIKDDFLKSGLMLVVDGVDPAIIREVLEADLQLMERRHAGYYAVLKGMGGYAPTMGILGTVMGLVNVLSRLENPSDLGHSIATAFIATLYGVASANMLFLPLAEKLKRKSASEALRYELMIEGVLAIEAGENPRIVQEKLKGYLGRSHRSALGRHKKGPTADAEATREAA